LTIEDYFKFDRWGTETESTQTDWTDIDRSEGYPNLPIDSLRAIHIEELRKGIQTLFQEIFGRAPFIDYDVTKSSSINSNYMWLNSNWYVSKKEDGAFDSKKYLNLLFQNLWWPFETVPHSTEMYFHTPDIIVGEEHTDYFTSTGTIGEIFFVQFHKRGIQEGGGNLVSRYLPSGTPDIIPGGSTDIVVKYKPESGGEITLNYGTDFLFDYISGKFILNTTLEPSIENGLSIYYFENNKQNLEIKHYGYGKVNKGGESSPWGISNASKFFWGSYDAFTNKKYRSPTVSGKFRFKDLQLVLAYSGGSIVEYVADYPKYIHEVSEGIDPTLTSETVISTIEGLIKSNCGVGLVLTIPIKHILSNTYKEIYYVYKQDSPQIVSGMFGQPNYDPTKTIYLTEFPTEENLQRIIFDDWKTIYGDLTNLEWTSEYLIGIPDIALATNVFIQSFTTAYYDIHGGYWKDVCEGFNDTSEVDLYLKIEEINYI